MIMQKNINAKINDVMIMLKIIRVNDCHHNVKNEKGGWRHAKSDNRK